MMKRTLGFMFRVVVTVIVYVIAVMIAGGILSSLGATLPAVSDEMNILFAKLLLSRVVIGVTFCIIVSFMELSRLKLLFAALAILFLNLASVILEGAYFVPGVITKQMIFPLLVQQLIISIIMSGVIALLFGVTNKKNIQDSSPSHSLIGWVWRIAASMVCYIIFYYLFGKVNFALFTSSYYMDNMGGLGIPSLIDIVKIESVRSLLIVLSVIFIAISSIDVRKRAIVTGLTVFLIGGVMPLVQQLSTLPTALVIASVIEILFQNFLTGVVLVMLIEYKGQNKSRATICG
ncbi:MAG: hypothetical protein GX115_13960 [Ruminiclostridium sp.]|nr:hypothetical protein [Ruminiclostridium sp.]